MNWKLVLFLKGRPFTGRGIVRIVYWLKLPYKPSGLSIWYKSAGDRYTPSLSPYFLQEADSDFRISPFPFWKSVDMMPCLV